MKKIKFIIAFATAAFLSGNAAVAQLPVEVFAGDKKSTLDVMFFRFFKKANGENSKILFFNRNRASVDYEMTTSTNLPAFGFTEAVSYNHKALKGFAPVFIGQIFNSGIYPKAGIQFYRFTGDVTVFSWLVSETLSQPSVDYYILLRYTPPVGEKLRLFTQLESINTLPTESDSQFNFTQRIRLGLQKEAWQCGLGSDLNQRGRDDFQSLSNSGVFFRYEFR